MDSTRAESFPDRRSELFGRAQEIYALSQRARSAGVTALVGRPLAGKTWVLAEVARQLSSDDCLVGYYESKGVGTSHVLYAVADLYARWLSDSTFFEQAMSIWRRHRDDLLPHTGYLVGEVFSALSGAATTTSSGVRALFDKLTKARRDLTTGGLDLTPAPYDQALALLRVVNHISGRTPVLILDAWEKSASLEADYLLLETFLKHLSDWPSTHFLIGIREPDLGKNDEARALTLAGQLQMTSPAAGARSLQAMHTAEDAMEAARMLTHVRERIAIAESVADDDLLRMIDGYPGVLSFWLNDVNRSVIHSRTALSLHAANAQALRYAEFHTLLRKLSGSERKVAARLAVLPRLDESLWLRVRDVVLHEADPSVIHKLIDDGLLLDEPIPTYGHDTRHEACRRWFLDHAYPFARRTYDALVQNLAANIEGFNGGPFSPILSVYRLAKALRASPLSWWLMNTVLLGLGRLPSSDRWLLTTRLPLPRPELRQRFCALLGLFLAYRGIAKMETDFEGALQDFNDVIDMEEVPDDIRSIAIYNRGAGKFWRHDVQGALADYATVIDMGDPEPEIRARAHFGRAGLRAQHGDLNAAISDLTAATQQPHLPKPLVLNILDKRAYWKAQRDDVAGAITDYSEFLIQRSTDSLWWTAFLNRALLKTRAGDDLGALEDYSLLVGSPDVPKKLLPQAFLNRGNYYLHRGDYPAAIADFTAIIESTYSVPVDVVTALSQRALARTNVDEKMRDIDAAANIAGSDHPMRSVVLYHRATMKEQMGDEEGARADLQLILGLDNVPTNIADTAQRRLLGQPWPQRFVSEDFPSGTR